MVGRVSSPNYYSGVNYAQMNNMRLSMAMSGNAKINSIQKLPSVSSNKTSANAQFLRDYQKNMTDMMSKSTSLRDGYYKTSSTSSADKKDIKKTASAISDMVKSYNSSLDFVKKNADKGVGVTAQKNRLERFDATDKELESIGITKKDDGTLQFDTEKYEKAAAENEKATEVAVAKTANDLFADSLSGMNTSSNALLSNSNNSNTVSSPSFSQTDIDTDAFKMFSKFAKSGAFNLSNMGVVGSMMNFSI